MTSPFISFSDGINGDRYDTKYQVEDGKIVGRTMSIQRAIWRGGRKVRRLPFMKKPMRSGPEPGEWLRVHCAENPMLMMVQDGLISVNDYFRAERPEPRVFPATPWRNQ